MELSDQDMELVRDTLIEQIGQLIPQVNLASVIALPLEDGTKEAFYVVEQHLEEIGRELIKEQHQQRRKAKQKQ